MFESNPAIIRVIFFTSTLLIMCTWELLKPLRQHQINLWKHWLLNFLIHLINSYLVRIFFVGIIVYAAEMTQQNQWGLLGLLDWPPAFELIVSLILLDLGIYWQHVAFHYIPFLWKFHKVHHSDTDFDVTTGIRFHPGEILISLLIKFGLIVTVGVSPLGILSFAVILNSTSLFNHGNVTLPKKLDLFLRWLIVTPDMHRVHHSVIPQETNSNFGFNLTWWDRLFKTYQQKSKQGNLKMSIGLNEYRNPNQQNLKWLLLLPFKKETSNG